MQCDDDLELRGGAEPCLVSKGLSGNGSHRVSSVPVLQHLVLLLDQFSLSLDLLLIPLIPVLLRLPLGLGLRVGGDRRRSQEQGEQCGEGEGQESFHSGSILHLGDIEEHATGQSSVSH